MALPKTTWSDVGRRCVEHRAPTPDGETYVYASCLADDMPSYAAVTIVPPGTLTELLEDSTAVVLGRPTHYRDNEDEYAKPTDPGLEDSTGVMELRVAGTRCRRQRDPAPGRGGRAGTQGGEPAPAQR